MLASGASALIAACCLLLTVLSSAVQAAPAVVYDFSSKFPTCSSGAWSQSGTTYTCSSGSISLASGDSILPSSSITVVAEAGIALAGNNTIGSATVAVNLQTAWGDLTASNSGNKTSTIYSNLTSSSGDVNLTNALVYGYIDTLDHAVLSGGSVSGNVSGRNGVTTTNGTTIGGSVTANAGTISLSGGSVTGSVHSDCCTITTYYTDIGGSLSTTVLSSNSNTVSITGGTISGQISTSGGSGISIDKATVTSGSITTTNVQITISNSTIGSSSSQVNVAGNNKVTITGSTVWGNVTAGDWSSALSIDSSSIIYGICASDNNSVTVPTQYPRCAGGSGTKVARFNACHNYSSDKCSTSSARLFTQRSGTAFATDIVALQSDGTVDTSFTGKATISVIAKTSTGAVLDSQNCFAADATQTIDSATSAFVAGRLTLTATVPTAYQDVRFKVVCDSTNCRPSGVTACSSDDFAIRPDSFSSVSVSSANADASGASTTATPAVKAGSGFTLTATAGAGYNGKPRVRNNSASSDSYVQAHSGAVRAGVVSATFDVAAVAATGVATASGATYNEVGYFKFGVDGVYDEIFAAVDLLKGDCTSDYSNTAVNGKIGCFFGNTAATAFFGRFIPDHFSLASSEVASCGWLSTTGTVAANSASLAVALADADKFSVGDTVAIKGAATGGYDLVTTISSKTANVLTLAKTAGVSVSGASVIRSGFIYMGQPFTSFSARVEARDSLEKVTVNYAGRFAAAAPVWVAENDDGGVDLNSGASGRLSGMPSGSWAAGGLDLSSPTASFTRLSTPDGAYDRLFLGLKLGSTEGVPLSRVDMNPVTTGVDCTLASSCTAWILGVSPVKVRFGRLKLANAFGSDRQNLLVPVEAQYWSGKTWVKNVDDKCTKIPASAVKLNGAKGGTQVSGEVTLGKKNGDFITLTCPYATCPLASQPATPLTAQVGVCVDLGADPSTDATKNVVCDKPWAQLPYLQGRWMPGTTYANDPTATATFGLYSPESKKTVHVRELY